jgi:NAD(P)-dependent dehydrogenase (short-subunit alcohol dehydrogenase family)
VNIARREAPGVENVLVDLSRPESWRTVREYLHAEIAAFGGERVIFVHNAAALTSGTGWAGSVDPDEFEAHVLLNSAAPLVLGEAFLSACAAAQHPLDAGLVLLSSTASTSLPVTRAAYGAGKAGVEQWVRAVREERRLRGSGPWVLAVLPGGMDTPGLRAAAATDEADYPRAKALRETLDNGLMQQPEDVARAIWSVLPPDPDGDPVVRVGPSHAVPAAEFTR